MIEQRSITDNLALLKEDTPSETTYATFQNKIDESFDQIEYTITGIADIFFAIQHLIDDICRTSGAFGI